MSDEPRPWPAIPAPFALPVGAAGLLAVGAGAAALNGRMPAVGVAVAAGLVVAIVSALSDVTTAAPLALIGWLTAAGFQAAPFGTLRVTTGAAGTAALVVAVSGVFGALVGIVGRAVTGPRRRVTLGDVTGLAGLASAVDRRRRRYGVALAVVLLPTLTGVLTAFRSSLSLADDLLVYLLAIVSVAVVGGFWPAIGSAVAGCLLVNWFFTEPVHTFTIQEPDNLFALLLFVLVAVSVSSVVHLAARRSQQAARSAAQAHMLLRLARTVLAGEDTPASVLAHLHEVIGCGVRLTERAGGRWVVVASAGDVTPPVGLRIIARAVLRLELHGQPPADAAPLVEAAAGQAAAALDRDRLRVQAAQAEALAAGNRMRTSLLAAVSHDLRTPLASIKAGISSLRQTDVTWSPDDERELLETIEDSTDRLDALIANLLDMSRVQTGAVQPYVHPTAVDEVAPLALRGIAGARDVRLDIPEDLPLVLTDAGLLERALANLVSNAVRYSPTGRPAELVARAQADRVCIDVVDHGPGVGAQDRDRIFEPFQRLGDHSTTGVGLGLAVARGFVEAVGGAIEARDTPGGGLTMRVTLPAVQQRSTRRPVGR
jgi:two-component system sensor histidine kinase KdpD